jgi:hypothetical protein
MIWSSSKHYHDEPYAKESDLEEAILEVAPALFGKSRFYLDTKKKIGVKGKTQ